MFKNVQNFTRKVTTQKVIIIISVKLHSSGHILVTCMIIIIDGHCGGVVVTQHGFRGDAAIQRGGADLRVADHTRVTEVDVEILVLLKDVVVNHTHRDLWGKNEI